MSRRDITAPLAPLLEVLANEIDASRLAILTAEHHVAAVLRGEADAATLTRDFQGIDLALQVLNDLQGFLRRLAEGLPRGSAVEADAALRDLTLERLSIALAGAAGVPVPKTASLPSIELF